MPTSCSLSTLVENAAAVSLEGTAPSLSAATLGNVVGGLLVGLAYWFVYHQKKASK